MMFTSVENVRRSDEDCLPTNGLASPPLSCVSEPPASPTPTPPKSHLLNASPFFILIPGQVDPEVDERALWGADGRPYPDAEHERDRTWVHISRGGHLSDLGDGVKCSRLPEGAAHSTTYCLPIAGVGAAHDAHDAHDAQDAAIGRHADTLSSLSSIAFAEPVSVDR